MYEYHQAQEFRARIAELGWREQEHLNSLWGTIDEAEMDDAIGINEEMYFWHLSPDYHRIWIAEQRAKAKAQSRDNE